MLYSRILDNVFMFVFWAVFFCNMVVFWVSLSVIRKKVSSKALEVFWNASPSLGVIAFLAFVFMVDYRDAFLNRPYSRLFVSALWGMFWLFIVFGLSLFSIFDALYKRDLLRTLNYSLWILALMLGIFQALIFSHRVDRYQG